MNTSRRFRNSPSRLVVALTGALLASTCVGNGKTPSGPSLSPSPATSVTVSKPGPAGAVPFEKQLPTSSGPPGHATGLAVDFPPRNEPFDFRNQLEVKYRDGLRRGAVSTFVDIEGDIVWIQEYIRYRVNACSHAEAVQKVFDQIDGRGVQPVCGVAPSGPVLFPPRNEPFDFRQQLEAKYRDALRRDQVSTFVDLEGDIVWIQEYVRYRVNGCGHAEAVQKVFDQIDGRGVQPVCDSASPPPPPPPPVPPPAPAPTVTSISPNSGSTNGGTSVTIIGSGFLAGATVTFGGAAASGVVIASSSAITATTPPHAEGVVEVAVTNPDGQSGRLPGGFTYIAPPPPAGATITITSSGVSPSQVEIPVGARVTFVNNDLRAHEMQSDPHPAHTDCPQINDVGFISPGQRKDTGAFPSARTCGFHDHNQPSNTTLQGRIVIR